ncbi:MAG: DUF3192 domain-containing protein [Candidatus Omnitrophica bacterium]|nr:DUF3192 domain-containing protein [Candidatus Omnitrophota bacterium]
MRTCFIIVLCISLVGCATMHMLGAENRQSIANLSKGMDKEQVIDYMGETYIWDMGVQINNPYRIEMLQGTSKNFEVFYYYTGIKRADFEITNEELTPLVFENGKLSGWGWAFLNEVISKNNIQINQPSKRKRRES